MRWPGFTSLIALGCLGGLLVGCSNAELPIVAENDASTADAVLAVRMSPQLSGMNAGATDGYVLLVDDDGDGQLVDIGPMDIGKLAWGDDGLYASGPTDEYLFTDNAVTAFPRGSEEFYETSRFLAPDDGFVSVYNAGFGENSYLARVTMGGTDGVTSWDATGMFESVSQCDDVVVGMTNIAETTATPETAGTLRTDALVQLYPKPANEASAILATLPIRERSFVSDSTDAACAHGVSYTLAYQYDEPEGTGDGIPVLRAWDTRTGEHRVISLMTSTGGVLDVEVDDLLGRPSNIIDDDYTWVDAQGRVFTTDLGSGTTTEPFDIDLASPEMGESQYVITDKSIFVLDVSQNLDAPLDFSRYDLVTGSRVRIFTVPGTGAVHDGLNMIIRDIALDPDWVSANE